MSESEEYANIHHRSFQRLFPPSTLIKDFAYPDTHPLKLGDFLLPTSSDDDDDDDVNDNYANDDESNDYNHYDAYSPDEINRKAIALFDFSPENDNEVGLLEGQIIWISYRHGQGWLVAEDPNTGENGLVPEEYVEIYYDEEFSVKDDVPKPFLPEILAYDKDNESEWVDTDYEEEEEKELAAKVDKLAIK